MLLNWLPVKPNKKMNALQKSIDEPNMAIEAIAQNEKYVLELAAGDLENASKSGESLKLMCLEMKERCEEMAKELEDMLLPLRKELALFESLKNREIEAFQNNARTTQETMPFSYFF